MPTHRRGRSLSEALTLEQSEEGGLVVSSINNRASANQGLREGDELLGATINFDQLSKEEVLQVLKLMEPFDDKVKVLTRSNLSKSLGNLDQCAKTPETMLKDSYSRLYNAKIKKFMRGDLPGAEGSMNGEITANTTVPGSSKVGLKHDAGLPRLGVDFGLLKPKTLTTDDNDDTQSDRAEELMYGTNLNLPPLGLGLNGTAGAQVPRLKVNASGLQLNNPDFHLSGTLPEGLHGNTTAGMQLPNTDSPSVDLTVPNLERQQIGLEKTLKAPEMDMDLKNSDVSIPVTGINLNGANITGLSSDNDVPKVNIEGADKEFKMPKFKMPNLGLSDPSFSGPECDVKTPDVGPPDVSSGKLGLKYSKKVKMPALNVDDPSSYDKSAKLRLSGKSPDVDLEMPGVDLSHLSPKGLDIDMPSGDVKIPLKKSKIELKSPDLDLDAPSGKFTLPKFGFSGKSGADVKTPDLSLKTPEMRSGIHAPDVNFPKGGLKGPNLAIDAPSAGIRSQAGKYKPPKFSMPKFDLPDIGVPDFNGDLAGTDVHLTAPHLNAGIADPKVDLNLPSADLDIASPSGKLKMPSLSMPDFGLSGPKLKGLDGGLKTPDFDLTAPKFKGAIGSPDLNLPKMDLNKPKLDLSGPDVKLDMPSGKLKVPEMKKPNIDLNAPDMHLKSPDLSLKAPKIKGGIDAPDLDLPNVDLKAPKLDVDAPDLNIGSPKTKFKMPKLKMPKFNLPGLKGPEIDGNLEGPDVGVNVPDVNLKGPKADLEMPDLNISGPSGKFKKPNLNLPDFGLSGPKLDGPNLDLKSPDLDISGPNLSGGINVPDLNMPKADLKTPKLDLNAPKLNLDMPSGKLKMPELHAPDWDVNAPSGKLKMPKFNLSGTLPKGGIDAPDLDMDVNAPKLDVDAPDLHIGSPKGKLKTPKLKMPKFSLPGIKGPEIDSPDVDLNAPTIDLKGPKADLDVDVAGPSGKFKKPKFHLPDFGLSSPKLDGPNLDLKSPELNVSGPNLSGGINAPDIDIPKVDLKAPKLDMNTPDVNIGSPKTKLKMPKLKMPKVSLPGLKGPEIDGNLDGPDIDIDAPDIKIKGSKPGFEMPNVGFGTPSGKLKKPHLKMPDVGFSSPKLDGPDFELPKGPNLNINPELKTPDLNLKVPKVKGEIDTPKLDLKAPKLNTKTPDFGIDLPDANFKKPKINMPKGPNVDIDGDLNFPNVDVSGPKGKLKMPSLNAPDLSLSQPKADINLSGPKLKGPDINVPDGHFPDASFKSPELELGAKRPDAGINGNIGRPDINFTAPHMNVTSGNFQGPQTDLDLANRKFRLPSFKLPEFGGPDLNQAGSDIDFGASLRPTNMDITPPNAKLNMRPPQLKGNITGPNINAPNRDFNMPNAAMRNPQLNLRAPDLNIDHPPMNLRGPSYRNRRSDIPGASMKMPVLDVDGDVRLHHTDRKSPRTKVRSSYPAMDAHFGHHLDFNHSDLNIDDFTGKDHVPRARGSKLDLHTSPNHRQVISPSGVHIDTRDPRRTRQIPPGDVYAKPQRAMQPAPNARMPQFPRDPRITVPNNTDGYYVTVFPTQAQNRNIPNRKYNTLGGADFHSRNMDLEVPDQHYLKGSTFLLSNLM